jgi:HEAT repeat protein
MDGASMREGSSESADPWLKRFRDSDVEQRLDAIGELAPDGVGASCYLLEALGDPEWRVRKSAAERLVALGFREDVIGGLIDGLKSPDNVALRNAAAEVLIRLSSVAVLPLLSVVTTADPDLRKFVVDILGAIGDHRATPALITLLSQRDDNVAMAAIEALGKLHDVRAVDPLIVVLRQDRPLLQFSAVKALQEVGDGRAVEPLIGCLGRQTLERAALEALGRIGDLRALNPLVQAVRLGSTKVKHTAVRALIDLHHRMPPDMKTKIVCRIREIYDKTVGRYILECLQSDDLAVKRNAMTFLGWMGDVQAIDALVAAYDETSKEEIVAAFIRMQREGVPKLLAVVHHAPDSLREGIARALGEIGDRKAVHGLSALASDRNGHVRQSAAFALGQLADPMGMRPLFQLLEDSYPNVREAAYHALTRFNGSSFATRLLELLESPKPLLRCYAAKLLGFFKISAATHRLTLDLKDPDPTMRRTALAALDTLGGDVTELFHVALSDEDAAVRLETIRILARRSDPPAQALLRPLLHDPDMWIRAEVIRILGESGGSDIVSGLLPSLEDPVGMIQIAACEALGKLRAPEGKAAMIRLLTSHDRDVKQAAAVALGELGGTDIGSHVAPLLDDPHWGVRAAAAVALGRAYAVSAVPRLREIAQRDPDQLVRESAHFALDQLAIALERAS